MEQKEITEKSGIAFKELFIVFKRLWILLLALVFACAAFFSWNDKRGHAPYTYTASTTLMLDINSTDSAEKYIAIIESTMTQQIFAKDVNEKKMGELYGNEDGRYQYLVEEYNKGLVNFYAGSCWIVSSEDNIFFQIYFSTTVSGELAKATLHQVVKSLRNFTNMDDGEGGYQLKNLADIIEWPEEKIYSTQGVTVTPYSNSRAFIIGIFFGLILSAVIVLFVYKLDDTVKSKEELERLTGALFLTYVEDIKEDKGGARK